MRGMSLTSSDTVVGVPLACDTSTSSGDTVVGDTVAGGSVLGTLRLERLERLGGIVSTVVC